MFTQGCQSNPTSGGASTVTFQIDYTNGAPLVKVSKVELTRNSDASKHESNCSISSGSKINVAVTIPASDNYSVYIQSQYGSSYALWNSVALTIGNTYSVILKTDGTSTLDSVIRDGGMIW